jgi:hypothetical protein
MDASFRGDGAPRVAAEYLRFRGRPSDRAMAADGRGHVFGMVMALPDCSSQITEPSQRRANWDRHKTPVLSLCL